MSLRDLIASLIKPKRKVAGNIASEVSHLQEWLGQISLLNLDKSAMAVNKKLNELYDASITPHSKKEQIELFHTIVYRLTDLLNEKYQKEFRHMETRRLIPALSFDLHYMCGLVYSQLILEHHNEFSQNEIATLCHRCFSHYAHAILRRYQLYETVKKGLWSTLYQAYAIAEQYNVTDIMLDDKNDRMIQRTSVKGRFIGSLLLGICNPYNLTPSEMNNFFYSLKQWIPTVSLSKDICENQLFVFSLNDDQQPGYISFKDNESFDQTYRGIDLCNVVNSLQLLLSNYERGGDAIKESNLSEVLVQHLFQSWNSVPQRRATRKVANGKIAAVIGLAATSSLLRQHYGFADSTDEIIGNSASLPMDLDIMDDEEDTNPASGINIALEDNNPNTDTDVWNQDYTAKPAPESVPSIHQLSKEAPYKEHEWQIVNASQGGVCLCSSELESSEMIAGQVVAIRHLEEGDDLHNDEKHWQIGIIRWVKVDNGNLSIGIQIISSDGFPVLIQNRHQHDSGHYLAGALSVMPEEPLQASILIAPSVPYQTGDVVFLHGQHYGMQAKLHACVESSGFYKLFNYEVIEHIYT